MTTDSQGPQAAVAEAKAMEERRKVAREMLEQFLDAGLRSAKYHEMVDRLEDPGAKDAARRAYEAFGAKAALVYRAIPEYFYLGETDAFNSVVDEIEETERQSDNALLDIALAEGISLAKPQEN